MYFCEGTSRRKQKNGYEQDFENKECSDYSQWVGHTDTHPLVSVIDYAEVSPVRHCLNNYSVYGIFFYDEANIDWPTVAENTTTRKEPSFVWLPDR